MAKKKQRKNKSQHSAESVNTASLPGCMPLPNYVQTIFRERCRQFQKNNSAISTVYEGLDLDNIRLKRRISSVISVAKEIESRFSDICPNIPGKFVLAEDWAMMNSYPVSAFDYVEKYVFSTLGAAIWILDNIRNNGKTDKLRDILCNAPPSADIPMPDVWDPCHSQQLLRQMVSIINNRNADCPIQEKAVLKNKSTVIRVYMDRPTAENKIDHSAPSRRLYDQVIELVDPGTLSAIKETYKEKYWDWLHRYFLCRARFLSEEKCLRSEIEEFQHRMHAAEERHAVLTQNKTPLSLLFNASENGTLSGFSGDVSSDQYNQTRAMAYQNRALYEKQEAFNQRFNSFIREVGEFTVIGNESIAKEYGQEIADIWAGFSIHEPYSMCMAFLLLLDQGSDLPWCYFPSVSLQSSYVCMLPWTRTRFLPSCDDIWEHFDSESGTVIPGPSPHPLSRKIKVPDLDHWYQLQYHDAAKSNQDSNDLYNLSHIVYEVTGCIMPRNVEHHYAALTTLNRYGINTKKANKDLLYCISLLGEARHQTHISQFPVLQSNDFDSMPESVEELQQQISALKEELFQCRQALQDAASEIRTSQSQFTQLQRKLLNQDNTLQDLSSIVFETKHPTISLGISFPYRTASHIIVFAKDETWIKSMNSKLPDIYFFQDSSKISPEILRKTDIIWIQSENFPLAEYQRVINIAGINDIPVRIFPFTEPTSCSALLANADISSC